MPVATTSAAPNGLGAIPNMATGSFTSLPTASDISIVLGFNPRYFELFDETDVVIYRKIQGDLGPNYWKAGNGSLAVETDGGITFPADTGLNEPGSSVYLLAALVGLSKTYSWVAFG